MKNTIGIMGIFCAWGMTLLVAMTASAQDQPKGMLSLGIGAVQATPALVQAVEAAGTKNQMDRVLEAMDGQLIDRLHNTRKFTLVSRSDLAQVLKEQNLAASGNIDTDDGAAAQAFKLAGCQFIVVTTVDNFQDYTETAHFDGSGDAASRRIVQFSSVAKIYDTSTGKLLESADFQLNNGEVQRDPSFVQKSGNLTEELYSVMARLMSQKIADRVIDVLRPAKIIARTDNIVTINRGDGTSIAIGQVWEVFAQGQEMKDPDTGASLGFEEVKVGRIRIVSVEPLFSKAEVIDDKGVDKNQICRLPPDATSTDHPAGNSTGTASPSAVPQ
jgi:curli biogenesis system outer membrane secretion channel CsgG